MGREVDEAIPYPYLTRQSECKPFVAALARNRRQPLHQDAPSSLRAACLELSRLFQEET